MVRALSYRSLIKMMSYPSVKNKNKNYSSGDVYKAIKKIKTGEISQAKSIHKYGILQKTLAIKCKKERDNLT